MNKNIHVLPTDKPSKLFKDDFGKYFISINIDQEQNHFKPQHLYITSDLEIKEGDWILFQGVLTKALKGEKFSSTEKVVLTTDQDLINDGVQKIDDEFLEWFVKNPSCEFVETKISRYKHYYKTGEIMTSLSPTPDFSSRNMQCEKVQPIYKIIIPQEEPNPFELPKALPDDVFFKSLEEPKQETFEEAAEKYSSISFNRQDLYDGFIEGAKWQAEKMYSEEEVEKIAKELFCTMANCHKDIKHKESDFEYWFKQHKKRITHEGGEQ